MSGSTPGGPTAPQRLTAREVLEARRFNEHLKLSAVALDRLSTIVLGGAVLAPMFQHAVLPLAETAGWIGTAATLHLSSHSVPRLLKEGA